MSGDSPVIRGLRGKCPECGEGNLFAGYLKFADNCDFCGFDFSAEDTGDGPAVLVISVAGMLVVLPALLVEVVFKPPIWVHVLLWMPISTLVVLGLLRPFRGMWYGLMLKHNAGQAVLDTSEGDEH
jgi:uncharacterized protein (DUF983 family)